MARSDYSPEINAAMKDPKNAAPKRAVTKPTQTPTAQQPPRAPGAAPPPAAQPGLNGKPVNEVSDMGNHHIPNMQMSMMPDMQRVNHAAGIAHAILGGRSVQ